MTLFKFGTGSVIDDSTGAITHPLSDPGIAQCIHDWWESLPDFAEEVWFRTLKKGSPLQVKRKGEDKWTDAVFNGVLVDGNVEVRIGRSDDDTWSACVARKQIQQPQTKAVPTSTDTEYLSLLEAVWQQLSLPTAAPEDAKAVLLAAIEKLQNKVLTTESNQFYAKNQTEADFINALRSHRNTLARTFGIETVYGFDASRKVSTDTTRTGMNESFLAVIDEVHTKYAMYKRRAEAADLLYAVVRPSYANKMVARQLMQSLSKQGWSYACRVLEAVLEHFDRPDTECTDNEIAIAQGHARNKRNEDI